MVRVRCGNVRKFQLVFTILNSVLSSSSCLLTPRPITRCRNGLLKTLPSVSLCRMTPAAGHAWLPIFLYELHLAHPFQCLRRAAWWLLFSPPILSFWALASKFLPRLYKVLFLQYIFYSIILIEFQLPWLNPNRYGVDGALLFRLGEGTKTGCRKRVSRRMSNNYHMVWKPYEDMGTRSTAERG